jgi:dTDP-4-dehydrorhamnose 3,5-epimerase-like enzyme
MGLLNRSKSNSDKKPNGRPEKSDKKVKYVYISSKKAVFLITGEPRENKYSYSVPIIPLHGLYYSTKDKRKYTAKELANYYVVLNIDEDDANTLKGKKIVVLGYNESETLFVPGGGKNGNNKE